MDNREERLHITFEREDGKKELIEQFNIDYSMYYQYYEDALKAVLKNIDRNTLRDAEKISGIYGNDRHGIPLHENNIIAFMGQRGSGKTTAITEFGCILEDYNGHLETWNQEIDYQGGGQRHFRVLPPIDASVLSAKEDLVEVILASMYQMVMKRQGGSKGEDQGRERRITKIIEEFDSTFKDYKTVVKQEGQDTLGGSVLAKLRNVSDSLQTKAAFEKLTESVLEFLDDRGRDDNNSYLVIIVDDLDMNPSNSFVMLDHLYKYFSNRKIIILIAIAYEQMYQLCQKNFVDILIPESGRTHLEVYKNYEERAGKLANDYLLKVLPVANRIFLPERKQLYLEAQVEQGQLEKYSVKGFMLRKIAEKTNIYYDACGLKKHFCLPNTVRELMSYNVFLDSLFSLEKPGQRKKEDAERQMALYDQNHERFNKDIEGRMARTLLNDEQMELYLSIMERHIERRAGYMVCFVRSWMKSKKSVMGKVRLVDNVDENNFCYVDLIEALYRLGRQDYKDKVLVHCILASFTSEMVREYYSYQYNTEKAKEESVKSLKNFLGTTFGGEWLEKAMPTVVWNQERYIINLHACYVEPGSNVEWLMEETDLNWKDTESWLVEILVKSLPYIECVSLLFVDAKDNAGRLVSPEWKFSINMGKTNEGTKAVLRVEVENAAFDMFGFLGREIRVQRKSAPYDEKIVQALETCATDYCDRNKNVADAKKIQKKLKTELRKKSIWHADKGTLAFPYYNFDMAYNIIKRVRRKMAGRGKYLPLDQICEYYRTVYGYIAQNLKEEEDYYKELFKRDDKNKVPQLYENFIKTPYIRAFGIRCEKEELSADVLDKEKLNGILTTIIKSLSVSVALTQRKGDEPE